LESTNYPEQNQPDKDSLAGLADLEKLVLADTQITDAAFLHLEGLPSLWNLTFASSRGLGFPLSE
jgi:hypothetical protein